MTTFDFSKKLADDTFYKQSAQAKRDRRATLRAHNDHRSYSLNDAWTDVISVPSTTLPLPLIESATSTTPPIMEHISDTARQVCPAIDPNDV